MYCFSYFLPFLQCNTDGIMCQSCKTTWFQLMEIDAKLPRNLHFWIVVCFWMYPSTHLVRHTHEEQVLQVLPVAVFHSPWVLPAQALFSLSEHSSQGKAELDQCHFRPLNHYTGFLKDPNKKRGTWKMDSGSLLNVNLNTIWWQKIRSYPLKVLSDFFQFQALKYSFM